MSTDTLPLAAVRELLRELAPAADEPVRLLIRGNAGSGKSARLSIVRDSLRESSVPLWTDLHNPGPDGSAVVLDDIHQLSADQLGELREVVEGARHTVVLAAESRPHRAAMRTLIGAVGRVGRVIDLRALSGGDIATLGRELGVTVSGALAEHIWDVTGGVPSAATDAIEAVRTADAGSAIRAVDRAASRWISAIVQNQRPDVLAALALGSIGSGLEPDELAEVLDLDDAAACDLVDRVRACGLVTDPDLLLPAAAQPLRTVLGDRRFVEVLQRLLTSRLRSRVLRPHTAVRLAHAGVRDARLADYLADAACRAEPDAAADLYAAAARAGARASVIGVPRAEAAASIGDYKTATRLAEDALTRRPNAPDTAVAVRVCAGIAVRRARPQRAAELYRWLGPDRAGADARTAAVVLYATGDPAAARAMLAAAPDSAPTDAIAVDTLVAAAIDASIRAGAGDAAATLREALAVQADAVSHRFLPYSPPAVAALLHVHHGDAGRAASILQRAGGRRGSRPADPYVHVLGGLVALLDGDESYAGEVVDGLMSPEPGMPSWTSLDRRTQLIAHATAAGLARRTGDLRLLADRWRHARPLLDDVGVDLFSLLPIGELWLAAIQLRDAGRMARLVRDATQLLDRLGEPPAWAATFHWYGVQAAILAGVPAAMTPHARALCDASAGADPYASALTDAGRTWLRVLRDEVRPREAEHSARELHRIGLGWDGARLAGEAALRAADTADAVRLVRLAHKLRGRLRVAPVPPQEPTDTPGKSTRAELSGRESEVADLLVLGLTYREVGARLYISAKTVEHHVARIRRRIGAGSRSELLSMLRTMGHGRAEEPQL